MKWAQVVNVHRDAANETGLRVFAATFRDDAAAQGITLLEQPTVEVIEPLIGTWTLDDGTVVDLSDTVAVRLGAEAVETDRDAA